MELLIMRAHSSWFAVTAALSGALGCVPEFEDDLSLVTERKVLAVRAEPAEVKPGTATRLSVLVAAPVGEDAQTEELSWALCAARKPLTELGPVLQDCVTEFGTESDKLVELGSGAAVDAVVEANACSQFGPLVPVSASGEASGRPVDPDTTGGYYQPLLVGDADVTLGEIRISCSPVGIRGEETISYNRSYRPNENPELTRLEVASDDAREVPPADSGERLSVKAGTTLDLRAEWPSCPREAVCGDGLCTAGEDQVSCREDCQTEPKGCTGAESYVWIDPKTRTVQPRREGLTLAWYGTAGHFESHQTGRSETDADGVDTENRWTAPKTEGLVRLWTVLRDDRGGTSFRSYEIDVTR
jgi:hypothetical protein